MSQKPIKESKTSENDDVKKFSVPVQLTDLSPYDGAFSDMKERFAEMRRIDEEIFNFSKNLLSLYGQTTTVQAGMTSSRRDNPPASWDVITKSPLVIGVGKNQKLKLQFDLKNFDPHEVTVRIVHDKLFVSAVHQEHPDSEEDHREFNREVLLPPNVDPDAVESTLSKAGILTVLVPFYEMLGSESGNKSFQNEDDYDN